MTELRRLRGYPSLAVGEHLLTMQVVFRLADALENLANSVSVKDAQLFADRFTKLFSLSGGATLTWNVEASATSSYVHRLVKTACEEEILRVRQYFKRLPFDVNVQPYKGALVSFLDFLVPLATVISKFDTFNKIPVFIMLDDADNLPQHLQRVLNSWVSTRSTHVVCLKITTQLGYATYRTIDNRLIESPHDFSDVNLGAIYTNENAVYFNRVEEIIKRRLALAKIETSVEEFFPRDETQAQRLVDMQARIEAEHKERVEREGSHIGPARARDEVIRTAIPRLMRDLAGTSRSSHTYSYAGFRSLVDLSSGVVRWFLEPASRMYDRVVSEKGEPVAHIPVAIQNKVIVDWGKEFIQKLSAFPVEAPNDEIADEDGDSDASLHAIGHETELYGRLRNLLDGLGLLFRQRILDKNASEQRVFSIVLRGTPKPELSRVLELGVRLGYLQRADNAAKEAVGLRQTRYIMARRLGPHYKLDVSGYAAHLSVMADDLEIATQNPQDFVRKRLKQPDATSEQLSFELGREQDGQ